ncbi:hypothetical protein [Hyphomicrobium sp. ghe19]|uniref:hypothetical protein n=1 Tax=Hyphomicrobium sp. ghe19 TaxID=2682968 RepID=UPI0013668D61|nr:hypothetical protein HYPP_03823 [Hyphomicrobium sp. ghe19]
MAQRESGYERIERDAYMTPAWATHALTKEIMGPRFRRGMTVWEPAAGTLQMVDALEADGLEVIPSDLHAPSDRPELFGGNRIMVGDFLDDQRPFLPFEFDAIITNPPYKLAEEFVRKALELTKPKRGLVAMLLGVKFDSAVTRSDIFNEHPAWGMKITLTDRIWWFDPKLDANGKVNGPSEDHAWFVWDWRGTCGRTMRYARSPEEVRAEIKEKIRKLKKGVA